MQRNGAARSLARYGLYAKFPVIRELTGKISIFGRLFAADSAL
jgi:hypothetical protein